MRIIDPAERLLRSLGIRDPAEIDLEMIACDQGAWVDYRPLASCEAEILGTCSEAVIAVDSSAHPRRQRFSIAHELGHWHHHRGRKLRCRVEEVSRDKGQKREERTANSYAASLLMPWYLLRPIAADYRTLTFKTVEEVAATFETSLTATAIRLVETGTWPCILVCHTQRGRRWFTPAPSVPNIWFPRRHLDPDSPAMDVVFGSSRGDLHPMTVDAYDWFDRDVANYFEIREQSRRIDNENALTILTLDEKMMDPDLRSAHPRSGRW